MTREPLAWVLNLDAEYELLRGARHTPSQNIEHALTRARALFAAQLPVGDVILDRDPDALARGLRGRCFCPTPSSLRRLERAGALAPPAPSEEVLRRVNERGFGYALARLDGARRCVDEGEVIDALGGSGRWLLKRGLGFAGRGQRRIDGAPSDPDRAWIRASLRDGALYVEPRVEIALEVALHGLIEVDGRSRLGAPTVQLVRDGAWSGSRRAEPGELDAREVSALVQSGERVARALHDAGYSGPFGVDAFRYRWEGRNRFHALGEINARYTMAWHTGMAEQAG